jgi:hypothetical protein
MIETKEFDQVEVTCFVNEVGQVAFLEWWVCIYVITWLPDRANHNLKNSNL